MDPDLLEEDARKAAAQGFGDVATQKQNQADKFREMLTKEGGIYLNDKFVPVPGWAENKANLAAMNEGYKTMATNDQTEATNYKARQEVKDRISGMLDIMQEFQTGAFSQTRNDIVRKLDDLGIRVPKTAQDNPDKFLEFVKSSYAQLFESAKALGGRILVSELSGLQKAGANAQNTPAANAYILSQALGVLNYEDKHTEEYAKWRASDEGRRATSTLAFDLPFAGKYNPSAFKKDAMRQVTYQGQEIPETADQLVHGQKYLYNGKPVYWNKDLKDPNGNIGSFSEKDPLAGGKNGG
jgi:hypothetical protein